MDYPAAWRELAEQFAKVRREDTGLLYASWTSSSWNTRGDKWYLGGTEDANAVEHFKWAAERAAVLLGNPTGADSLFFWLDLLKNESPRYRGGGISETHLDEGSVEKSEIGHIGFLCLAAQEQCYRLETVAIEKERTESLTPWSPWNPAPAPFLPVTGSGISPFTEKAIRDIANRLTKRTIT